ncbi:uncharacterized protein B0H18DRAFT_953665 [Fomitopsis serialis]|uniref:uncharacterized protein n=1 Tax=Fomitopsis serialis TaxID=139415 RepID=UPI002008149F|nr:uncharacterized protein B0H18DRAFT_953665 [Neoantrodia serialis]KAH9929181.1 hypothetical protein B0H18DRAFT_953665 [Neoantrodia serialis]
MCHTLALGSSPEHRQPRCRQQQNSVHQDGECICTMRFMTDLCKNNALAGSTNYARRRFKVPQGHTHHEASQLWRTGGMTWLMPRPDVEDHTICGERIQTLYRPWAQTTLDPRAKHPGNPDPNPQSPQSGEDIPGTPEPNLKL